MRKVVCILAAMLLLCSPSVYSADDKFVLVIDAGHGGKDSGAIRGKYKEKSINLGVALALGRLIDSNMPNVKVVFTRKNDNFVDLYKRAAIANKAKANLFISIHTNSTASAATTAQGADTYILGLAKSEENLAVAKRENSVILFEDDYNRRYEGFDPRSPESYIMFEFMTHKYMEQSLDFATNVQRGFLRIAKRKDRGVRQAGFLVLRESAMPSVLIELGFINNLNEGRYLASSTGQRAMASSIYGAVEKYVQEFEKKRGRVSKQPIAQKTTVLDEKNDSTSEARKEAASEIATSKKDTANREKDRPRREKTEPPVIDKPRNNSKAVSEQKANNALEYRVQFCISTKRLSTNSEKFKGLSPVKEYLDNGVYKYTYGSVYSETEAIRLQKQVRTKFKDAFVIKFRNGVRVK